MLPEFSGALVDVTTVVCVLFDMLTGFCVVATVGTDVLSVFCFVDVLLSAFLVVTDSLGEAVGFCVVGIFAAAEAVVGFCVAGPLEVSFFVVPLGGFPAWVVVVLGGCFVVTPGVTFPSPGLSVPVVLLGFFGFSVVVLYKTVHEAFEVTTGLAVVVEVDGPPPCPKELVLSLLGLEVVLFPGGVVATAPEDCVETEVLFSAYDPQDNNTPSNAMVQTLPGSIVVQYCETL